MMGPKVGGAEALLTAGGPETLDWVVFFSSTTAVLGVAGLGHYAAANAVLDAWACERRLAGVPVSSIGWGTWDQMRAASQADRQAFKQGGLLPMASAAALDAMARILASGAAHTLVASVDWRALRTLYRGPSSPPAVQGAGGGDECSRVGRAGAPSRRACAAGRG